MKTQLNDSLFDSAQLQFDRGLHYGDGLFETIAVKVGVAELLDEHMQRLIEGCSRIKLNNIDFTKLEIEIEQQAKSVTKGIIKVIVTRGCGGRGYSVPEKINARYLIFHYL